MSTHFRLQMHPRTPFPFEIFEAIIDHARIHRPSLCSISLSCHAFLDRARRHLFFHVYIATKEKLEHLPAFLRERPWLPPLIGFVTIIGSEHHRTLMLLEVVPVHVLTQCPSLRTLELVVDTSHEEPRTPYVFSPTLRTLSTLAKLSGSIRHLTLKEVRFLRPEDFTRLLYAFPCLESLVGTAWNFSRTPLLGHHTGKILLGPKARRLTRLTVSSFIA